MRLSEIHLRDPFVFAEDGVYYLYGTRRGFDGELYLILHSPNVDPNERPRLFRITETDDGFEPGEQIG